MGLVFSKSDSGLLVAEQGASDERAVARLLKDHDPDLRLVPRLAGGQHAWSVYRYAGPDRPAEFLCFWGNDQGEPFPLSTRIVDMVRALDKNSRVEHKTSDERNQELVDEKKKRDDETVESLKQDHLASVGRSPAFHRGIHLRRDRETR